MMNTSKDSITPDVWISGNRHVKNIVPVLDGPSSYEEHTSSLAASEGVQSAIACNKENIVLEFHMESVEHMIFKADIPVSRAPLDVENRGAARECDMDLPPSSIETSMDNEDIFKTVAPDNVNTDIYINKETNIDVHMSGSSGMDLKGSLDSMLTKGSCNISSRLGSVWKNWMTSQRTTIQARILLIFPHLKSRA